MTEERPDPGAYATTGLLETRCPNCGAEPGAWCTDDDGRGVRRIPCVDRLAAAVRALRGGGQPDAEPPTASEERDLSDGFPAWRRPPPDVEPKTPPKADLPPIPTGPGSYRVDEVTLDRSGNLTGGTRTEGPAYISKPIMTKPQEGERK
ncbi:zinc finger domain-containing protein [Mycobacterium avium]|uniref:zinc finger domain-containing protein n=1 Tax=Mycobacterium avium TaxID=1764 RepID=UPI001CC6243E|nr:hypothetical protein [Mycobacterium avium]MBZ4622124.1 hypothetical protein [Mycobacterium avium subsp. hominissuis]